MFGACKLFLVSVYLVLSIQAAVVTAAEVDHRKEASVTVPTDNLPYTLTGANAVLTGSNANQGRAVVNANLRKSEEIEGDHEGKSVLKRILLDVITVFIYII